MSLMTAFVFLALGGFAIFGILRIHDKTLRSIGTQSRRKPLTDEQIWELYCDWHEKPGGCYGFARAIENHHGIK